METQKTRGELLVQTVPFQFQSGQPIEKCRSALFRVEDKSTVIQRYRVETFGTERDEKYETCEFRIVMQGYGVEAVGRLRAGHEEQETRVEGEVGVSKASYYGGILGVVVSIVLVGIGFTSSMAANPFWWLFVVIILLGSIFGWLWNLRYRENVIEHIYDVLDPRRRT